MLRNQAQSQTAVCTLRFHHTGGFAFLALFPLAGLLGLIVKFRPGCSKWHLGPSLLTPEGHGLPLPLFFGGHTEAMNEKQSYFSHLPWALGKVWPASALGLSLRHGVKQVFLQSARHQLNKHRLTLSIHNTWTGSLVS